ncbi:hypothetical protein FS749_009438, partial [Ceratobasidium sp. UAMH 11750]
MQLSSHCHGTLLGAIWAGAICSSVSSNFAGLETRPLMIWKSLLIIGFATSLVASMVVLTLQVEHFTYLPNPLPGIFTGCFVLPTPNLWLPFIFGFTFETVIFVAMVWRTRKLMSEFGSLPLVNQLFKEYALGSFGPRLVLTFYDTSGSFFYAAILLIILFTCIGATIPSIELAAVGSG